MPLKPKATAPAGGCELALAGSAGLEAALLAPRPAFPPPETVFVKLFDGSMHKLPFVEARLAPYIELLSRTGAGREEGTPILLPQQVNAEVLDMVVQYMRYHSVAGRSDKEKRAFNERFVRVDVKRLCELTSGADALKMRGVVDLASRQLARMIEGKSPEQIRAVFNLPDDLTEEEKLEPIRNVGEDARIRLLNRLYAKKRQELIARKDATAGAEAPSAPAAAAPATASAAATASSAAGGGGGGTAKPAAERSDSRSVEELLSFIDGGAGGSGGGSGGACVGSSSPSSAKKKKKKAKPAAPKPGAGGGPAGRPEGQQAAPAPQQQGSGEWDIGGGARLDQAARDGGGSGGRAGSQDLAALLATRPVDELMDELFPEDGFEDSDKDQELVGEFERRLTADWSARAQELLHESPDSDPLAARLHAPAGDSSSGGSSSGRDGGGEGSGACDTSSCGDGDGHGGSHASAGQATCCTGDEVAAAAAQGASSCQGPRPGQHEGARCEPGGGSCGERAAGCPGLHVACRAAKCDGASSGMAPGTPAGSSDERATHHDACGSGGGDEGSGGGGGGGGGEAAGACSSGRGSPAALLSGLRDLHVSQLMDAAAAVAEGAAGAPAQAARCTAAGAKPELGGGGGGAPPGPQRPVLAGEAVVACSGGPPAG